MGGMVESCILSRRSKKWVLIISDLRLVAAGMPNAKWIANHISECLDFITSGDKVFTMKLFKKIGNKMISATFNK